MLKVNEENLQSLDISFEMTSQQRALMASAVHQEWFAIFQKLMEEEIRKMTVKLMNTDAADEKAIVANFRVVKGASQFYVGMIQRLEHELQIQKLISSGVGTLANPEEQPSVIEEQTLGGEYVTE